MKKYISFFLIIAMLCTCVVLFSACSKVSEREMEKDPHEVLSESLNKTLGSFFSDEAGIKNVLKKTLLKGKYTVSFASDELIDGDLSRVTSTIYLDGRKKQSVVEASIGSLGEEISATLFVNGKNNNLALTSEDIFGSGIALLFDPETFVEKFADSALAGSTGLEKKDIENIVELVDSAFDGKRFEDDYYNKKIKALINDFCTAMEQSVRTEKLENKFGTEREYVISKYIIKNDNVKKMIRLAYDFAAEAADANNIADSINSVDLEKELDELLEKLDERIKLNLTVEVYVDKRDGTLYTVEVDGSVSSFADKYELDSEKGEIVVTNRREIPYGIEGALVFGEDAITVDAVIDADGDEIIADVDLTKAVEDGDVSYVLTVNIKKGAVTIEAVNAQYKYKKDGDISLEIKIPEIIAGSKIRLVLEGHLTVEGKSAELTVDYMKLGGKNIDIDLTVKAESVNSIPEFPKDTENIVNLSEGDIDKLVGNIKNSYFGGIVGIGGSLYGEYKHSNLSKTIKFKGDKFIAYTDLFGVYQEGTYAINGDLIIMTVDGSSTAVTFEKTENGVIIAGQEYIKK